MQASLPHIKSDLKQEKAVKLKIFQLLLSNICTPNPTAKPVALLHIMQYVFCNLSNF